jgi:DUF1365 family protein
VLGHVFNPVSFWLAFDAQDRLRAFVAEVTNTFGDRLSYLCHREDRGPIGPGDALVAEKALHVSPFQPVEGRYTFRMRISADRIAIRIDYARGPGEGGLVATLSGPRRPLTDGAIIGALLRRPLGARRVLALIHWQALKLWWKGARYRRRPAPPEGEIRPPGVDPAPLACVSEARTGIEEGERHARVAGETVLADGRLRGAGACACPPTQPRRHRAGAERA